MAQSRLWTVVDGEPFLDNPRLLLLNPRKKRRSEKMARRLPPRHKSGPKKGQFMKRSSARSNPPKRRRRRVAAAPKRRRRSTVRVYASNPPRRRRRASAAPRRRRRSYRRNPAKIFTKFLSMKTFKQAGFTVLGVAATPFVEGFVFNFLPVSLQSKYVRYAVQIASAYAVGNVAGRIFGREQGNAVYIGGATYIALGLARDFFPGLLGGTALGKYPSLSGQPLLGKYASTGGMGSFATYSTPERLSPSARF